MHAVRTIILVVWVVFWLYWLAASVGVKPGRSRWGRTVGIRLGIAVIVVVLLHAKTFKAQTNAGDPWLAGIGLAVVLSGLAVAVWARLYLGRNWGTPMSEKVDPELVTTGPYGSVRHPIYSGIVLAMAGTAIALSWYWLIAVALLGASFVYSAIVEEQNMTRLFPDAYPAYRRRTKMLIPFLL